MNPLDILKSVGNIVAQVASGALAAFAAKSTVTTDYEGELKKFSEEQEDKKKTNKVLDFLTSPTVAHIIILSYAAGIGLAALLFPVLNIGLTIAAVAVSGVSVVSSVLLDTYHRYTIKKYRQEDKLLAKVSELELKKAEVKSKIYALLNKVTDPELKGLYADITNGVLGNLVYVNEEKHKPKTYKASISKIIAKCTFGVGGENLAACLCAVATFNPLALATSVSTIAIGVVSAGSYYAQTARRQHTFHEHRASLLNDMERAKEALSVSYQAGRGVEKLQEVLCGKTKELENLQVVYDVLQKRYEAASSSQKSLGEYDISLEGEILKQNMDSRLGQGSVEQSQISQKLTEMKAELKGEYKEPGFFSTMGKVLKYGWSFRGYNDKFSPLKEHDGGSIYRNMEKAKGLRVLSQAVHGVHGRHSHHVENIAIAHDANGISR